MIEQANTSRIRRIFRFVVFRFLPFLLLLAIIWSGYSIADSVVQRIEEQNEASQRSPIYDLTATVIAPSVGHEDADEARQNRDGRRLLARVQGRNPSVQEFVTNTPRPLATVTATPLPVATVEALPTLLIPANPAENLAAPTAIPTRTAPVPRDYDLVNIVLLGGDEEVTGEIFFRTDTMIILSINKDTGTVAMLSLPRDLFVYIPNGTMQRLNTAFTIGEQIGWTDGGWGLLRQTIFYNLGINTHFFARVNLSGLAEIIDTVGGVSLAVDCAIQDFPLVGAEVPQVAHFDEESGLYTLPVGVYHLTGDEALWYARSRRNSDDFDRGRRQQQVLRAIWSTARESGQLADLPDLWSQGMEIVDTNVSFATMLSLLPLALELDGTQIENFTLTRWFHTTPWTTPDGSNVQLPNPEEIRNLLIDFYIPPTDNQLVVEGAQIAVFNGTGNADWDFVASSRLVVEGMSAFASGDAERSDYVETVLIDRVGSGKASSRSEIARLLNVRPENIVVEPDPNRIADFEVIVGHNYQACTAAVLPVE